MLVAVTFRAKAGKEKDFEELLNDPEAGLAAAKAQGAIRNSLFLKQGVMIRILEFPDGSKPVSMYSIAERDPKFKAFLRAMGSIVEDGFDVDRPETIEAFNRRNMFPLAYDVKA